MRNTTSQMPRLHYTVVFKANNISQGNVAMQLEYGGIFSNQFNQFLEQ